MGIDHLSKSLVEGSKSINFEGNSSNPNLSRPVTNPNNSLSASSLLSPLSDHSPQQPSSSLAPEMQPKFEEYEYELPSNYLGYNQSVTGSEVSMEEHNAAESENQVVSGESSEYLYDGSLDWEGVTHFYKNNNPVTGAWPAGVGGSGATSGNIVPPAANYNSEYQYPTEQFMKQCHLCGNHLYKERKEIFIFKGEYAFCSPQCREVKVGCDDCKEMAYEKAQKKFDAKRLENIGKFPVVFQIGPSASASSNNN